MTRPRMLLGGAALVLLLAICGVIQWYRNATAPVPVVITCQPPDPPRVTQAAVVTPSQLSPDGAARGTAAEPAGSKASAAAAAKSAPDAAPIVVHVVGAVKTPGVYHLRPKARLLDAVRAAGGAKSGADLEAVNLASFVQDGEQIRVPALSERRAPAVAAAPASHSSRPSRAGAPSRPVRSTARYPLAAASPASASPSPAAPAAGAKKMTGVVDVNRASAEELTTLPGVGPKTAAAILAYRQEHGAFQRVEDLLEIRGIGEKKLAKLREWVTVR